MVARAKHQVFISSTYADLVQERQALFRSTYRMGHIPIGMEGFVASNMSQWEYIEQRVRECDYFVVVIAHRYGSLVPDNTGRSFTEAEIDLAESLGKPVLRFIIHDQAMWKSDEVHRDHANQERLERLKRTCIGRRLVAFWHNTSDLEAQYSQALAQLIADEPRGGLYPAGSSPISSGLNIKEMSTASNSTDHSAILASSGAVSIVLNDGYHFFEKYGASIKERVEHEYRTRVLLIHPESMRIDQVAKKSNKSQEQQVSDIWKSVGFLRNLGTDCPRSVLEVRGHDYLNCYSASWAPDGAIISLYFTRMRSSELMTMHLSPGALHSRYGDDIDQLWRDAETTAGSDLLAYPLAEGRARTSRG